jgi:DNA polymerase IV (DinB-like DNA polymerase)
VVVCVYSGRTQESGVVSTSNYEARKYGVRAGIPIAHAKKLLETVEATFLPMNRPLYEQVSERIMEILKTHADSYEKVGIDEAYLDLTLRTNRNFEQAEEVAGEIKQQILQQEHITCTVGIAPNKLLAKIASDHKKPDGLTVVKPEEVKAFLTSLPVNRIPGVGKKVDERLTRLRVNTVGELSALDPTVLLETFGKSLGSYLYRAARGEDDEPVREREQPTQFSRIGTLKRNTHGLQEILPLLNELADSATEKLTGKNMICKSVGVIAILDDLSIHSRSRTLESPTCNGTIIKQSSNDLMEQFLRSMPTVSVRRVGVKLSGLSNPSGQTNISKFLHA